MGASTRLLCCAIWTGISGCATWEQPQETVASLPAPGISRDAVVFEIKLVHLGEGREQDFTELWGSADELQWPPEVRRRLAANGLRCGIVRSQLPPAILEVLAEKKTSLEQLVSGERPDDRSFENYRRLTCAAGVRYRIAATPAAQIVWS